MYLKTWLFVVSLALAAPDRSVAEPQCIVIWILEIPCRDVVMDVVSQIKKWTSSAGCAIGGERCQYTLQSASRDLITATHTSHLTRNVDDLSFGLSQPAGPCRVKAVSSPEVWFHSRENGTSYCNLYNLMEGSGLTKTPGFKEITNKFICPEKPRAC